MNLYRIISMCILMQCIVSVAVAAETAYITGKIQVGLHQEKTLDSPIVVILPSGTAVEIIKREKNLSYIQGPGGQFGWVDNSYLVPEGQTDTETASIVTGNRVLEKQLAEASRRIRELENDATTRGTGNSGDDDAYKQLKTEHSILQKQFYSERLKAGELQVKLAKLRKRVGQDNDNVSLYHQIEQLQEDNKTLEVQLANALDTNRIPGSDQAPDVTTADTVAGGWKRLLIYLSIAIMIGLILGIYFMDYMNRRKHGGFRI